MRRELYRTHTSVPKRGTLWQDPRNSRLYRVTKAKQYGEVIIVYGTAASLAAAQADLNDALRELGHKIDNAIGLTRFLTWINAKLTR